jgi:signal transduction histidine kinase
MNLLNKTNLYFLGVSLIVFTLGGIFFFFLFQVIIDNDLTNKLHERKHYVIKQIAQSDSLLLYQKLSANTLSIKKVDRVLNNTEVISDTVIFDEIENRFINFRQLIFFASSRGNSYNIHIRRALVEQRDLVEGVFLLEFILFLGFVAILTLLNNQLSKSLWKPFYEILDKINSYKLDHATNLTFRKNSTSEFNELASTIEKMSAKINQEFLSQKEFIENASHEIQTPLAIIRNKVEVLLQSPEFSEKQLDSIHAVSLASSRISKINEALLILSRIENRQFHQVEDINVNERMKAHLLSFQELIQMKEIKVEIQFHSNLNTKMNPYLADMLFENLITNAIKHNNPGGSIEVIIHESELIISNPGATPRMAPSKFFGRFVKSNPKSQSLGLGLPIVKAICDTYLIAIHYDFEKNLHKISLKFPSLESLQN